MSVTRRQFVAASSSAVVYSLLANQRLLAQAASPPATLTAIRRNVSAFSMRGGTIGILEASDALIVVDTQFADTAQTCLDRLRAKTARPIDLIVNTHHHGDHTGGNTVMRGAGKRIVAHERSAALQRKAAEGADAAAPKPTFPDVTFAETWSETVGDETIRLRYLGPGHTSGDAVVTFEKANVVHMGDLVFHRMHGFIDVASGAEITSWARILLATVDAHDAQTQYIFGHAAGNQVIGTAAEVSGFRDYLVALMDAARAAVAKGLPRDEFVKGSLGARFDGFTAPVANNPNFGLVGNLGKAWDEASKK